MKNCRGLAIVCLGGLFTGGPVFAEDAGEGQFEELEQQVRQLEAEQAAAERRATEQARRRAEEAEQAEVTARKEASERAAAEERSRLEAAAREQADAARQQRYLERMERAESSLREDRFQDAVAGFEAVLSDFRDDARALAGLQEAQRLLQACSLPPGQWQASHGPVWNVMSGNAISGKWLLFSTTGRWECISARNREFVISWPDYGWVDYFTLSEDGNTLNPARGGKISASRQSR